MDAEKRQRYEKIAAEIVRFAGGRDNILGVAHCATRLRLVLEDNDRADIPGIENVDIFLSVLLKEQIFPKNGAVVRTTQLC